jgi:adenosine deaminase
MSDLYRGWNKAELHIHLEGSVEPSTILELEPSLAVGEIAQRCAFSDFPGFLKSYVWVNRLLRTPRDYRLITARLLARMQEENIRYAEITLSAGVVLWKEQNFDAVFSAVAEAAAASPVEVRWILDAVRQFGAEAAMQVARVAVRYRDDGVVAFGIGGDETAGPVNWFGRVFDYVRDNGLQVVPHAGETGGADSVWGALQMGAYRIGHGIAAARDVELMAALKEQNVPLEICLTSNLCTGVIERMGEHPLRTLYEAGVPLTLNTDDPALFRCSLAGEFELAERVLGFSQEELRGIAANAFRYALDPNPEMKPRAGVSNE